LSRKVGIGIVGLGYMGNIHLRHLVKIRDVDCVAVADFSKKALREAQSYGVRKRFVNYQDLVEDDDIDAVIIALPTHLHLQCAAKVSEAGKDFLLEKPMARNPQEAREILRLAEKNSVKLMMGYHLRFHRPFQKLKVKVENRQLGDIEVAYATFISSGPFFHRGGHTPVRVPEWWFDKNMSGGGALIDVGSHIVNLLRWYFGEIRDIKACFGHRFNLDFEDSAVCFSRFESGTLGVITAGYFSQGFKLELEFFGSVNNAFAQHQPPNKLKAATQMLMTGKSSFHQAHYDELRYFVHCVANDLLPSPSGLDGVRDIEAIDRAYKNEIKMEQH